MIRCALVGGRDLSRSVSLSHSDSSTGLPVAPRAVQSGAAQVESAGILAAILDSLADDKAEDVVQIDLRGRTDVADFMVIASGRSSRQVTAIAEKLAQRLKQDHAIHARIEGRETADWVLIDTGDVIVHVFRPEVREFYQLERIWLPAAALAERARPALATAT